MTETALAAAMKRGGIKTDENILLIAISRWQNHGGTFARLVELARAAYKMPVEGHAPRADHGQPPPADDWHPTAAGGHPSHAHAQGQSGPAPDRKPDREAGGLGRIADKATDCVPPPREPTAAQRKAAISARKDSAKAVLDLGWLGEAIIPGGPKYTDLRVRDLPGMIERQLQEGATHARSAVAIRLIEKAILDMGVADPDSRWVDVLPASRVREIARATETETLRPMAVGWLRNLNETAGLMIEGTRSHE